MQVWEVLEEICCIYWRRSVFLNSKFISIPTFLPVKFWETSSENIFFMMGLGRKLILKYDKFEIPLYFLHFLELISTFEWSSNWILVFFLQFLQKFSKLFFHYFISILFASFLSLQQNFSQFFTQSNFLVNHQTPSINFQ